MLKFTACTTPCEQSELERTSEIARCSDRRRVEPSPASQQPNMLAALLPNTLVRRPTITPRTPQLRASLADFDPPPPAANRPSAEPAGGREAESRAVGRRESAPRA